MFVPGTLGRAPAIGRAGRRARERGEDAARAMAGAAGDWVLFASVVARTERDDRAADMVGYGAHIIAGASADVGHTRRVWDKAETPAWRGAVPEATSAETHHRR